MRSSWAPAVRSSIPGASGPNLRAACEPNVSPVRPTAARRRPLRGARRRPSLHGKGRVHSAGPRTRRGRAAMPAVAAVALAQSAEHWIVAPEVTGSIPVGHPTTPSCRHGGRHRQTLTESTESMRRVAGWAALLPRSREAPDAFLAGAPVPRPRRCAGGPGSRPGARPRDPAGPARRAPPRPARTATASPSGSSHPEREATLGHRPAPVGQVLAERVARRPHGAASTPAPHAHRTHRRDASIRTATAWVRVEEPWSKVALRAASRVMSRGSARIQPMRRPPQPPLDSEPMVMTWSGRVGGDGRQHPAAERSSRATGPRPR